MLDFIQIYRSLLFRRKYEVLFIELCEISSIFFKDLSRKSQFLVS